MNSEQRAVNSGQRAAGCRGEMQFALQRVVQFALQGVVQFALQRVVQFALQSSAIRPSE